MKTMNVGIIGYKFMGKAHSNAWSRAHQFFDMGIKPVMKVACGRHPDALREFADNWGWEEIETDWKKVVSRPDIDIIDICVPQYLHFDIAMDALKAGKHVFCEKPLAMNVEEARLLCEEADMHAGLIHYVNHNYRRCPAVMLAKQLIDEGKIGRIFHWRGAYLQDWIVDPNFPLTWHLQADKAGMGPQGDLNSHSVDLARFLIGEIESVSCMTANFITERVLPDEAASGTFNGTADTTAGKGKVTVEDAAFMHVRFTNGALGSFETTRFAPGRKNYNYFEIYGSKGSLVFNLERMNELQFFSLEDPSYAQGFKTIMVTEGEHAYISGWWPPGHIIGYEHEFVHAVVDFMKAIESKTQIFPNFHDGLRGLEILSAGLLSAKERKEIRV